MASVDGPPGRPVEPAEAITEAIRRGGPALVALSGGVDSAVVAALAFRALGPAAHAVTLTQAALSSEELESARAVATHIGIDWRSHRAEPLADPAYRANPPDRCYFCRRTEATELLGLARELGVAQILDGVQDDDLPGDRPGLRAMEAAGVRHPLRDAGWGKREVRAFARSVGLPNGDRPANACLASRIAPGEPVSKELLHRIERAEALVRGAGFLQVRVRARGGGARIEVGREELPRLLAPATGEPIRDAVARLGFTRVELDPEGYGAGKAP